MIIDLFAEVKMLEEASHVWVDLDKSLEQVSFLAHLGFYVRTLASHINGARWLLGF